jgi:hypothetical protein
LSPSIGFNLQQPRFDRAERISSGTRAKNRFRGEAVNRVQVSDRKVDKRRGAGNRGAG